ncbi:MAG: helix-turn-helix transcriptional regulator [Kiritimatiellae bacterium]|nr:helix-turn-helix transcriptional regulator [Kiritimatiellia bacterium]
MNRVTVVTFDPRGAALAPTALWRVTTRKPVTWPATKRHEFGLHYVIEGAVHYRFAGFCVRAGPGDIVFVNPGDTLETRREANTTNFHAHFGLSADTARFSALAAGDWYAGLGRHLGHGAAYPRSFLLPDHLAIRDRDRMGELFAALLANQAARGPGYAVAHHARFLLLLQLVSAELVRYSLGRRAPSARNAAEAHVARALQAIESALGEPLSRARVAAELGLTPDYLAKVFKKSVGRSIGAYILERRLALARELLLAPNNSIKQVARRAGFRDALYFSRVFHREIGMAPRDYVRRQVGLGIGTIEEPG